MIIDNTYHLSLRQLDDLKELRRRCQEVDSNVPNLYLHILSKPRALPASYFYYEQEQLLGFTSAFFFYETTAEVAILVCPGARKQGIAKRLLQAMLPLVQLQGYTNLLFSSPSGLHTEWFEKHQFIYKHTEYCMGKESQSLLPQPLSELCFRKACLDDIELLSQIDARAFRKQEKESDRQRFEELLDTFSEKEYTLLVVLENNQIVGKAHLRWQTEMATLSDIAVIPEKQGKGLGTALIVHCINMAFAQGRFRVVLDVETHNKRALALYTRLGFETLNACDYWSITLKELFQVI